MRTQLLLIATIFCSFVYGNYKQINDETLIKLLLEKESATWRSGDIAAHASCWHIQLYSKILVSTIDGKMFDVPPQNIINPPKNMIRKGGTSKNLNYKFSINENNAWVSHEEESTSTDGIKTFSTEIRILEKINGEWKLVAQSIHYHK